MIRVTGIILFMLALATHCRSQIKEGLTGVTDTSYTTASAYLRQKKDFPETRMPVVPVSKNVIEKQGIIYHRIAKRKLLVDAFYPLPGKANGTAIIIIHGGGWRSGNRAQHHDMARALAARGYSCFTPEYRLSTEAYFPAAVYDIKEAVKWVRLNAGKYRVDTSRIVIAGFSAGGQLAALVGSTANMPLLENYDIKKNISTEVHAVIDIDGTTSFVHEESSEQNNPDKVTAAAYWLGYTLSDNPVLYATASPLTYAAFSPPVLFLNSAVERMHAGRDDFIKILNARGVYNQVHTFDGSPHSFCLFEPWFTPTINLMQEFLDKVFHKNE